jgi:flagellar assembly protein FliH
MRSLSKVIHPGQYSPIISEYHPIEYSQDSEPTKEPVKPVEPEEVESPQPQKAPPQPDVMAQRRQILERAFQKAQEIVQSAQRYQAEQLRQAHEDILAQTAEAKQRGYTDGYAEGLIKGREEGSQHGYQDGYQAGKMDAQAENRKTLDELGMMIEAVEKSKTKILRDFQEDLIELSTTMAKAILKQEIQTNDKALRGIILSAMEEYRNQEWIRIYVPQDSANILLKADGGIAEALKDISDSVKVVVSPDMEDGGCIIEMPDQVIDAGLNSQLAKLRQAISEAVRKKPKS